MFVIIGRDRVGKFLVRESTNAVSHQILIIKHLLQFCVKSLVNSLVEVKQLRTPQYNPVNTLDPPNQNEIK